MSLSEIFAVRPRLLYINFMLSRFSRIFVIVFVVVALFGLGTRVLATKNGGSFFQKNESQAEMVGHNAVYDLKLTAVKRGAKFWMWLVKWSLIWCRHVMAGKASMALTYAMIILMGLRVMWRASFLI